MIEEDNYIAWVASRKGRDLTHPERELVTIVCAAFRTGPWHIHDDWSIMRTEHGHASISVFLTLSTYDGEALTHLVFAAHDRCCRVDVGPGGPRRVTITVSPRVSRDAEAYWDRHPTIGTALADWRKRHPEETP